MRIRYDSECGIPIVYVNGERMAFVIEADDNAGYVDVVVVNSDGSVVTNNNVIRVARHHGKVSIDFLDATVPAFLPPE